MPYAIRLPDGRLVENIPDDLDPVDAKAQISAHFKLSEPVKKNTSGFSDVATAAKQAFVGAAKSATDVFGADNEYSEKLAGVQQRLEQEYTPERALERQKREQLQEEAAKSGDTLKEISTYLGGVTEAPVQALASGVASVAPYAALALGAKVVGLPVGIVLSVFGAAQSAGAVKGGIYETIKKELEKTGVDSEKAKEKAIKAQEYFGDNFGNIAAAGGIGAVAGRRGIEGLLVPGALAKQQANIVPRVATSMLKEAPIEGLQGGQQQFAENVALQQEGFDVPTFQGVAGSAARDAAIGAITAAPLGAIARPPKVDLEATYTNVIDELRNTLGTSETLEPQEVLKKIQQISQLQDPAQIQALYETALNNGDFNTVPMPDNSIRIQIPEASTQQKAEEAVEDSTPDAFTPELRQSIESFKQPIIKQMQRFGLSNVGLKIFDTIENGRADGYYANKVIALAMDSPSPIGTLRHETVHALRELGGFKPNEWNVLSKKAKNEWTDQFIKNVKVGDGTLYDQYQAQYQKDNNGSLDGFDDYITEEAVAEAFRYFDVNGAPSGLVGNLYYRLKQFFETIRNGFTGAGFDTTDKIFTRVEQGKAAPTIKDVAEQPIKYALTGEEDGTKGFVRKIDEGQVETNATEAGRIQGREELLGGTRFLPASGRVLAETESLNNTPQEMVDVEIPSMGVVKFGPNPIARQVAETYMANKPYRPATNYGTINVERSKQIAKAYDEMKHEPNNPQVKASYKALAEETLAQWQVIKDTGLQVEFISEDMEDPYKLSPRLAIIDVNQNNHLWVFPTDFGYGDTGALDDSTNPMLAYADEIISGKKTRVNDIFRIVHDYFGHIKDGMGFRSGGEENAWRSHVEMYSPLARPAMTVETRGQNSWVNFGPYAEFNKTANGFDTKYAPQKLGLLPDEFIHDGRPAETDYNPSIAIINGDLIPNLKGKPTVDLIGAYFDRLNEKPLDFKNKDTFNKMVQFASEEIKDQLKQENSGLDWYEQDIKKAFTDTIKVIPELDSVKNRQLFNVIAGIMSPSTTARDNWVIAAEAFQHYVKTGEIPAINPKNKQLWMGGLTSANKKKQLNLLNNLVKELGADKAVEWMYSQHPISEINKIRKEYAGLGSIGGKVNDSALGLFAFGPKVGPFVSNLNGIPDVTVDKWMTRTFNRYIGRMVDKSKKIIDKPTEQERTVIKNLINEVAKNEGIKPYQAQSILWFYEQRLFRALGTPSPSYGFSDGASKFLQQNSQGRDRSGKQGGRDGAKDDEGRAKYSLRSETNVQSPELTVRPSRGSGEGVVLGTKQEHALSYDGIHYSNSTRETLNGSSYGTGIRGKESLRLGYSNDPRIKNRSYFYIPHTDLNGQYLPPEGGLGTFKHQQKFDNILGPGIEMRRIYEESNADEDFNNFESAVIDNGYDGYASPNMGMMVILNHNNIPVEFVENIRTKQQPSTKYSLRAPNTPEFKRFFGSSKIVNEDGTPKVMYHGTARDITEFRPKQANAIFLTEDPDFAESFTESSENYMAKEIGKTLSVKEETQYMREARKIAKEYGHSLEDALAIALQEKLPSRANIMPVFVKAENPFDYENPEHLKNILQTENGQDLYAEELPFIRNGAWSVIETSHVQRAIKEAGFDGFYVREGGNKNLAVYNSNQIKSATGNVGTFDIGTPDIRYSLNRLTTLQTNKTAGQKISQAYDTARSNFGNSQYWIAKRNGWIDPSSGLAVSLQKLPIFNLNGELRADMLVRAKSQALNLIKNGLLSGIPVLNADGTIGIERSENNFARSMYLADQLNNNAVVKASGLSGRGYVAEVARILRGADILKEDARLNAEGVQQLAEAKIATKEAKDLFKQGKMKEARKKQKEAKKLREEGTANAKSNRELQVTPAHIKWAEQQLTKVPEMNEILGIWKAVNNGLVDLWEEVGLLSKSKADEYRGKDNYIPLFKSQEDLGDAEFFAFPGGGLKSTKGFKRLKGSTAIRNIWENLDKHYAVMLSHAYENQTRKIAVSQLKSLQLAELTNANDPESNLWYKEDGKKVGARVENLNDLAAFQMMTYELGPIMQFFAGSTQLLRTGALINPMYWIKQLIRDPIHANLVAGSGMITPLHSMRGFVEVLMKNSRESKILTDRGVLGSVDSTTTINQFLEQFGKEKASPSILSKALSKVMSVHEASDAATRVEIYKKAEAKALKEGKTAEQAVNYAVHMARESINFSVHGNSPTLNALRHSIPFFSAAINSLDTVYRAATGFGLNAKEKKEAQLMFFNRAVMMTILSTMYAMLYQDDEEYKKLPDYVKDNNWLIPNPMSEKPPFIRVPTPFEIGFFFKTIPEGLVRYFSDTSTGKEVLASYKAGLIHNLPANGLPIPQAIKPVLENIVNYSFFTGRGIEGMSDQGRPVAERGQRASEFAKTLSSYGLDRIGQSPAKIDNLIQGYFAELGTFSAGLASSLLFMAEGKEPPAKNIENMPFMKAFLTDRNVVKAISDFYELDHNAKEVATQFNDLKQSGMTEDIQKLIDDPEKKAQLMASPVFRKVSTQMATIRKAIKYYKDNQDSGSADFRRDKINELTEILGRVAESGYKIAEATGVSR